jgi:hypothetical protein
MTHWENQEIDVVLKNIHDKIKSSTSSEDVANKFFEAVRVAGERHPGESPEDFINNFIAENPDQYEFMRRLIDQILQDSNEFVIYRNPGYRDGS